MRPEPRTGVLADLGLLGSASPRKSIATLKSSDHVAAAERRSVNSRGWSAAEPPDARPVARSRVAATHGVTPDTARRPQFRFPSAGAGIRRGTTPERDVPLGP